MKKKRTEQKADVPGRYISVTKAGIAALLLSVAVVSRTMGVSAQETTAAAVENESRWFVRLEAEQGKLAGTAKKESPGNISENPRPTLISFLDRGESNSVTFRVNTDFSGEANLQIRYRCDNSGRRLTYKVNGEEQGTLTQLDSGGWGALALTSPAKVSLTKGDNMITLYAPADFNGPGVDYITLSRGEVKEADTIAVKFMSEEVQQGSTIQKPAGESVEPGDLPPAPQKEGYDFLGWYFGNGSKYEASFPLSLSDIPDSITGGPGGELVLRARFGHNTPASPAEKQGYRLIFQDEFDAAEFDTQKWVDRYLSSWSKDYGQTQVREIGDGVMSILIRKDTQPWCREFDGETVVSGFATGQRNGLHKWAGNNQVRNPEDVRLTHINQYGYYEMRAKGQSGSSRHSAWWLTGFEDVPEESAEIDIFEVLGKDNHAVPGAVHSWADRDAFEKDGGVMNYRNPDKDFNNEWHVYGFDWQKGTGSGAYPDRIVYYIDGQQVGQKNVRIDYPMIQLLSLYEKRRGGWTGAWEWAPYPNSYEIDYVRVYKKLPDGAVPVSADHLRVVEITAHDIEVVQGQAKLVSYDKNHGGPFTEKTLPGTRSYVRVQWNDGIETQEPVVWDAVTDDDLAKLNSGVSVEKSGTVPSVGQSVTMRIRAVPKN